MSVFSRLRARPKAGKRFRTAATFLAAFVVLGLAANCAFYCKYLADVRRSTAGGAAELKHLEPPPGMSAEELVRVGWVFKDRKNCFANFAEEKPAGVVRIGCFGGSFVYGAEVDEEGDYPAALERVFHEKGFTEVEVLNFGNPWYGCQQAFMLWDSAGRRYDLDCVVFGPGTFGTDRDLRFNHAPEQRMNTLHSRYVLEGDDVRRMDVVGNTLSERIDAYYAFLPPLRYLRYDRNPPIFLRCLVGMGRTLANPFYYDSRSEIEEAEELWSRILRRIPESGTPLLIVELENVLVDALRRLGKQTAAIGIEWPGFPYQATAHFNAAGNRLLAEIVFNALTGRAWGSIETFRTTDVEAGESALSGENLQPLDSYRRVAISTDQQELGVFGVLEGFVHVVRNFGAGNAQALLALSSHTSLFDAMFLRIPFDLDPKARLALFAEATGESVELGRIETPFPGLPIRVADLNDVFVRPLSYSPGSNEIQGFLAAPQAKRLSHLATQGPVTLRLGELELARAPFFSGNRLSLTLGGSPIVICASEADPFAGREPEPSGTLYLALERANGEELRVPFGRWTMEQVPFDLGGSLPIFELLHRPLDEYERVALESGTHEVGHFVHHEDGTSRALASFQGQEVQALLALSFSRSLLDALMIPLPELPTDGEPLHLHVEGEDASTVLPVPLVRPSSTLDLWVVDRIPFLGRATRLSDGRFSCRLIKRKQVAEGSVRRLTLTMQKTPLVSFERDPENGHFLAVPHGPRTFTLELEEPRSEGPYRLVFEGPGTSESVRVEESAVK